MKLHRRLKDAPGGRVFAVEKGRGYLFFQATLDQCWDYMQAHKHVHECIRGPCRLYFDLDGDPDDVRDATTWLKRHLDFICTTRWGDTRVVTLTAHGQKGSAHIIVHRTFLDNSQCKLFVERLKIYLDTIGEFNQRLWDTIDTSVYAPNKLFRMLGMSKVGQDRPFRGVPFTRKDWEDTLINRPHDKPIDMGAKQTTSRGKPPRAFHRIQEWLQTQGEILSVWSPPIANWVVSASFRHFKCPYKGGFHKSNHNYVLVNIERQQFQVRCQDQACKKKGWKGWRNLPPGLHNTKHEYLNTVLKTYDI